MKPRSWFSVFLLFVCLVGLLAGAENVRADDSTPGLPEYWGLVRQTRNDLGVLVGKSPETVRAALSSLATRWEKVHQVRLDDGRLMDIDTSYWVSQLRAVDADPKQLLVQINALLNLQPSAAAGTSSNDLTGLRVILARPEFQYDSQAAPNWLQEMINRFMDWLGRLIGAGVQISPGVSLLRVLGGVAGVMVVLALVYVLRGFLADLAADSMLNPDKDALGAPLNAQSALARAEGLSNAGDYRSAVRYLYLSALLILDERGLLFYDRTRTNREYLRDLASRPQLVGLLRAVIDVFDRVWYGFQPLDADSYRRYADQVNELKEQK